MSRFGPAEGVGAAIREVELQRRQRSRHSSSHRRRQPTRTPLYAETSRPPKSLYFAALAVLLGVALIVLLTAS